MIIVLIYVIAGYIMIFWPVTLCESVICAELLVTHIIAIVINKSPSYVNVLSHRMWGKASCRNLCEMHYHQHQLQPMLLRQLRHI